ncbi:hypothetical protein VM1G_06557 [Cytospora mali]|uniref:F-box domain-containing protein n=1 Tax=Cytospora mali TaxID=578113 RepID=A0A194W0N1_CYTMA|nr:hypothetical protein VM1G_06557 [Valsa mali]
MPRRPIKGSRPRGRASPTPISSAGITPAEADFDADDAVNSLDIGALTLDVPIVNKKPVVKKARPFPFMDLPSELRVKIYNYHFADIGPVVDLEPGNYFAIHKKLCILRVCRQMYHEASHAFYSSKTFRIFPIDGRYAKAKKGLLARLKPQSRAHITSLELRLGPGWSKPYRSWVVNDLLGLEHCVNVRCLSVFVEIDPSDGLFDGWRKSNGFYETFTQNMLGDILQGLPHLNLVQFDAGLSVKKAGDMMQGLLEVTRANKRNITWGPERGWTDNDDDEVNYESPVGPTTPIDWSLSPSTIMAVLAQQKVQA